MSNSTQSTDASLPTTPPDLFDLLGIDNPDTLDDADNGLAVGVEWQDVETPESVPMGEREAEVAFAERILEFAISHDDFGHHRDISDAITSFANAHRDDDSTPDYWRKRAYQLGPKQLNMGRITAQEDRDDPDVPDDSVTASQYEKARVIIAWAGSVFDTNRLDALEKELATEQAEAWADAYQEAQQDRRAATFLVDPPEEYSGWKRLPSPADTIAYAGPPTNQSDEYDPDADAEGEFILLFRGDGYHRLLTFDFAEYERINPATTDTIDTHDIKRERRHRIGNPESWTEAGQMLLDHLEGAAWPDDSTTAPDEAMTPAARSHDQRNATIVTTLLKEDSDLIDAAAPATEETTDEGQAGLEDF
jgi:hypothetical protein